MDNITLIDSNLGTKIDGILTHQLARSLRLHCPPLESAADPALAPRRSRHAAQRPRLPRRRGTERRGAAGARRRRGPGGPRTEPTPAGVPPLAAGAHAAPARRRNADQAPQGGGPCHGTQRAADAVGPAAPAFAFGSGRGRGRETLCTGRRKRATELIDGRLRKDKKKFVCLAWGGSLSVRCTSFVWFAT